MKKVRMFLVLGALLATVAVSAANKASTMTMTNHTTNGKYTLMTFWSSSVEGSLLKCLTISNALNKAKFSNIEFVAVALEPRDLVKTTTATDAAFSEIYENYLNSTELTNYLLDDSGAVIAKNITPESLSLYANTKK